jgi:hypothetical protein
VGRRPGQWLRRLAVDLDAPAHLHSCIWLQGNNGNVPDVNHLFSCRTHASRRLLWHDGFIATTSECQTAHGHDMVWLCQCTCGQRAGVPTSPSSFKLNADFSFMATPGRKRPLASTSCWRFDALEGRGEPWPSDDGLDVSCRTFV